MENLLWDLTLIVPMHVVNAFAFLVWRFNLLGPLHAYNRPVSERIFGSHRDYIGAGTMFASATLIYSFLFGYVCIWPGIGMVAGTYLNSIIKRRLKIKPGASLLVFDQLDFFIGGVAGLAVCGVYLDNFFLMAVVSFALHVAAEIFAYLTGMKKVWW